MSQKIRGSDVYVVEDIERILAALAGASRRYGGDYGAGYGDALRDVATAVGLTVDAPQLVERVHEVVEYRAERTVERSTPRPATVVDGGRAPVDMTRDDTNVHVLNTAKGRLVEREQGYGWFPFDVQQRTVYWDKSAWELVDPDEYRSWGETLPDEWLVLVHHFLAARMRMRVRVLPTERRQLR